MSKYDFELDDSFITEHLEELIHLVDYVPFSFAKYNSEKERDEFLKSENLLSKMQDMDHLINAKCNYYEDSIEARNSVIIEWLDCHPEFEGVISNESSQQYQNMKNHNEFLDFIDFLYDVQLPSEKDKFVLEDTSSIKYPDFNKMKECFDKYPNTLLSCYLSYLVQ